MNKTININNETQKEILLYALTFLKSNLETDVIEDLGDYIDLPGNIDASEEVIQKNLDEMIDEIVSEVLI